MLQPTQFYKQTSERILWDADRILITSTLAIISWEQSGGKENFCSYFLHSIKQFSAGIQNGKVGEPIN
jgi:hypothetical protein